jgi:hypothetical protein
MIALIAPEPAFWLSPLLDAVSSASDDIFMIAPWAFRREAPAWFPSRLKAFLNRRVFRKDSLQIQNHPGWVGFEGPLRLWAGKSTPRRMAARFWLRRKTDSFASRSLPPSTRIVIAPSCAAETTFSYASKRKIKTLLVEDLPAIRELQEDLDRAAKTHPQCAFLKRYRASPSWIVRQERERVLADRILIRGHFARALREEMGILPSSLLELPGPDLSEIPLSDGRSLPSSSRILLAGLATARNGIMEALRVLESRPHLTLQVRSGEGMEPPDLLRHPQVVAVSPKDFPLHETSLVVAPAWCESYPPELAIAAARGIPIVATRRASGFIDLESEGEEIQPGDAPALGQAIDRLLGSKKRVSAVLPGVTTQDTLLAFLKS